MSPSDSRKNSRKKPCTPRRSAWMALLLALAGCRATTMPEARRVSKVEVGPDFVHYEVFGDGAPVIAIHGGGVDRRVWDAVTAELASDYQLVRYDRRGYGLSPTPSAAYDEGLDLRTLVDSLGFESVHLLGEDVGAGIAIDFALSYPERVRSLGLIAPAVRGYKYSGRYVAASTAIAKAYKERGSRAAAELWLGRKGLLYENDVAYTARGRLRDLLLDNDFVFQNAQRKAKAGPPAWRRLHQIQAPTLVLIGESEARDHQIIAAGINARVDDVKMQFVPRAGHMIALEQPEELTSRYRNFLRQAKQRPAPTPATTTRAN